MNLSGIQADCYRQLGMGAAPVSGDVTRILSFINEGHRKILGKKQFYTLRRKPLTFSSIANVPFAALPRAATRIHSIQDRVSSYIELEERPLEWIRRQDPALRATMANPWAYAIYDLASAVTQEPAGGSQLTVVSTSAADTGATSNIKIEGVDNTGHYRVTNVNLNGTTPVNIGPATGLTPITKFWVGTNAAAGAITLNEGATEISRIGQTKNYARYTLLHLYPTPSAVRLYNVDVDVHVEDMSDANDEPLTPEDFHHLLTIYVRLKEYAKREKAALLVQEATREWTEGLRDMNTYLNSQSGSSASGAYPDRRRFSQLGPWFESGT